MKVFSKIKFGVVVLAVLMSWLWFHSRAIRVENKERENALRAIYLRKEAEWGSLSEKLRSEINNFKGTSGVFIKDLDYGFEFRHNENSLFPSASLAKIPIMAAAYKAEYEGILDLQRWVMLREKEKLSGSGTLKGMPAGTVFTVEELIKLMVSISDNTATNMLTSVLGIEYINEAISVFGLKDSRLNRRVADYAARDKGLENYTTASDMSLIMEKMYRGVLVNQDASRKCLELLTDQKYRDRIPKYLPPEVTVAHKTGLERGICHDAGVVYSPDGDFLICVLTKHSNTGSLLSKNFIARLSLLTYERHEDSDTANGGEGEDTEDEGPRKTSSSKKMTVTEIQVFLKDKGLLTGPADGIIGPKTRRAIKEFQKLSGLESDGIAGEKTLAAIREDITKSKQ